MRAQSILDFGATEQEHGWQMSQGGQGRRYRGGISSHSALETNGRTLCFWLTWEVLSSFGQRMGNTYLRES